MSPRTAATVSLVLGGMAGWSVIGGVLATMLVSESKYSSVPFMAGAFTSVFALQAAGRLHARREWPDPVPGSVPWVSELAQTLLISGVYVRERAREASLPVPVALAWVWIPWWGLLAFWVFLMMYAFIDIVREVLDQ